MNTVSNFLFNWQTIIASFIALLAAYVATRPAWRQAEWAKNQAIIQSREIFMIRRGNIIDIKNELEEAFIGIVEDDELYMHFGKIVRKKSILSNLRIEEILIEDFINPDWAREKHAFVESTIENLALMRVKYSYIDALPIIILQIQTDLEKLRKCLYFIYYGNSEEFEMAMQQPETELSFIEEVNLGFKSARNDIQKFILNIAKVLKDLDDVLSREILKVDASLTVCDASLQKLC